MILQIYCLRDKKADVFARPMFVPSLGVLIRDIQRALVENADTDLARYPADFSLFRMGSFDDVKGKIELEPLPDLVLEVSTLLDRPVGPAGASEEAPGAGVMLS